MTSNSAVADQIAANAASLAEQASVPAVAIGVITEDGLVEQRHLGVNHAGEPVTSSTLFEIGSATKAFLGVTQAILVDRGQLAWHDRVIDHYPGFEMHDPWVTGEFRIDDLLSQRTGLSEFASQLMYSFGYSWEENVKGLKYLKPVSSFRSAFAYQNITHYVAGEIVAGKVGAESWNAAAEEMLFAPLGMTSSRTAENALTFAENTTRGHTMRDGRAYERGLADFPSVAQGAGSIVSNLEDMAKWVSMHLNEGRVPGGRLLSPEQLRRTYVPLVPVIDPYFVEFMGMGGGERQIGYATGWFVHALPEGRVISHSGVTPGYNSTVMFDPDRRVGLVILSNQGHEGGVATFMGKHGMDVLQGREPRDYFESMQKFNAKTAGEGRQLTAAESVERPVAWYEGVYEHELLGAFELRADDGLLHARVGPQQFEVMLKRKGGHVFGMEWNPAGLRADWESGPATFEGEGECPDRVIIEGFTFERTSVPANSTVSTNLVSRL